MPPPYDAESSRLWLEPLNVDLHLEDFHELWTDAEAVKWTTRLVRTSLPETAEWMKSILRSEDMPDIDKWAILLRPVPDAQQAPNGHRSSSERSPRQNEVEKPRCIGIVGTNRWSDQGMETGYCLHKDFWGKGYATEAFRCFLEMYWKIEERENIPHLVAKVYPGNMQSVKVLKKCGGREGEVLKRTELKGGAGEIGDLHCWYYDRPKSDATKTTI